MAIVTGTYEFEIDETRADDLIAQAIRYDLDNLGETFEPYSIAKAFDVVFRNDGLDWLTREHIVVAWGWVGDTAPVDDQGGSAL